MTHPMTDERLAELRKLANLTDYEDLWWALHNETELEAVGIDDFRALLARLDAAEQEIQLARRERSILMDVVGSLTEEQLSAIPEGKLVLALRTMDEADKAADYHTFVDGLIAELASYKAGGRDRFVSIVKKLDAAEELLREVANSGVEFDDHRLNWIAAQIGRDTFTKCRSYLR